MKKSRKKNSTLSNDLLSKIIDLKIQTNDNPLFQKENNDLPKEKLVLSYKEEGNTFFSLGKYKDAINSFTKAIELDEKNEKCYSNRSWAYSKLNQFENALVDANKAICMDPENEKYKFRAATALCGLCKYYEAKEIVESILKNNEIKDVRELFDEIIEKILQSEKGKYDFYDLFKNHSNDFDINVSDYIGPLEIKKASHMGRGVFATRDIHAGELLSLTKAFAFIRHKIDNSKGYDVNSGIYNKKDDEALITACTQKCSESLYYLNLINLLCDGSEEFPEVDIKTFHPLFSYDKVPRKITNIDNAKIKRIISYNGFSADSINPFEKIMQTGYGIWIFPSLYNHSCEPNADRNWVGDLFVVRAAKNIKKGEEIFVSYIPVESIYSERANMLKFWKIWNCECRRCKIEKNLTCEMQLKMKELNEFVYLAFDNPSEKSVKFVKKEMENLRELIAKEVNDSSYIPVSLALTQMVFATLKQAANYSEGEVYSELEKAYKEPQLPNWKRILLLTKLVEYEGPTQEFYKKEFSKMKLILLGFIG